tara:strand:+ start:112 stop:249 length:138 start_codon:yes stop_codon:yes gene_type:complete
MKEFSYKKYGINYERVGDISCLSIFGFTFYQRVGSVREILGFVFR